ncbi:hypothetical protein Tco_1035853 [Tanacetum coccineum]
MTMHEFLHEMVVGECHEPNSEGSGSAWMAYIDARITGLFLLVLLEYPNSKGVVRATSRGLDIAPHWPGVGVAPLMSPRQDETSEPLLYAEWMAGPYRFATSKNNKNVLLKYLVVVILLILTTVTLFSMNSPTDSQSEVGYKGPMMLMDGDLKSEIVKPTIEDDDSTNNGPSENETERIKDTDTLLSKLANVDPKFAAFNEVVVLILACASVRYHLIQSFGSGNIYSESSNFEMSSGYSSSHGSFTVEKMIVKKQFDFGTEKLDARGNNIYRTVRHTVFINQHPGDSFGSGSC